MSVRLGENGFQLIAGCLPRNLQLPGGYLGRGAASDNAGKLRFRRGQPECLSDDRR